MIKICNQVNVVETDNSAQDCEKFISTNCIIKEEAITYLGLPVNSTVTEILEALVLSLQDARNRIIILEDE